MFSMLPMYQRIGNAAFKKDLTNTLKLLEANGNPHQKLKTVHIAGTNGKGSSAHSIAAILQTAGYKTGLYTSPHLKDFTERIRINGLPVDEMYVCNFIARNKEAIERIQPSFFEITVVMAFDFFAKEDVDIAVIEVGLGGRLDSTNVITPEVSLITSIGYDHQDMLGETLPEIAGEKAGIIKPNVPVVIGDNNAELESVFQTKAAACKSPIHFAKFEYSIEKKSANFQYQFANASNFFTSNSFDLKLDLIGDYYLKNLPGILSTTDELVRQGWEIIPKHIVDALANVKSLTGLKGRWQVLSQLPITIADVGHNKDGISVLMTQLLSIPHNRLFFVIGGVRDKKWDDILPLLPRHAEFYITQPTIPRAIEAKELAVFFDKCGLNYAIVPDVNQALEKCRELATANDLIFVGGSTFVVAELNEI